MCIRPGNSRFLRCQSPSYLCGRLHLHQLRDRHRGGLGRPSCHDPYRGHGRQGCGSGVGHRNRGRDLGDHHGRDLDGRLCEESSRGGEGMESCTGVVKEGYLQDFVMRTSIFKMSSLPMRLLCIS